MAPTPSMMMPSVIPIPIPTPSTWLAELCVEALETTVELKGEDMSVTIAAAVVNV